MLKYLQGSLFLLILSFFILNPIESNANRILGVHLVDVSSNSEIGFLQNGNVVDLAVMPQINLSAIPASPVTKILFYVNGIFVKSEGVAPYAIGGDGGGIFNSWSHPGIGNHILQVYPVIGSDTGDVMTINFQIINSASNALYSFVSFTEPNCFNSSNASATVNGIGGIPPYSYSWSNGSTAQQINSISKGTYTVTVTDNNAVTSTTVFTIIYPLDIIMSSIVNPETNVGNDGSIILSINGGTSPFSFQWSNGSTSQSLTNLSAGNYTVTVTDGNGCTKSDSYIIKYNSSALRIVGVNLVDVASNTELGFLKNGNVIDIAVMPDINLSAIPTGNFTKILFYVNGSFVRSEGSAPYAIGGDSAGFFNSWIHPGIGFHTLDIVAVNNQDTGAFTTLNIQIINSGSNPLYSFVRFTEPDCANLSNGTAFVNGIGGNPPYSYSWSSGSSTQQITNLAKGTYTVTITDNNSNTSQTVFSINFPKTLTAIAIVTDESCFGNDGKIELEISGGTESYIVNWSNASTSAINTNLSAGNYTLTVTDFFGCSFSNTYTLGFNNNAPFQVSETIQTESCFGNDGAISINYSGGLGPYSVLWSNGSTSNSIVNLVQGNYSVTISDSNACSNTYNYSVPFDPLLGTFNISSVIVPDKCYANGSGSINLSVLGGNTPYSFVWSNGTSSNPIIGLNTGNYTVTISEQNGCTTVQNYFVDFQNTDPSLVLNPIVNNESCIGGDGSIQINATGGTNPLVYSWGVGGNANCGDFLELDSVIIIEAENVTLTGDWTEETNLPDYTGDSYIEWRTGDTLLTVLSFGTGILSYSVNISHPGRYHFLVRSSTVDVSEYNDCYIRFMDSDILLKQGANSYVSYADTAIKLFQNTGTEDWTWQTKGARGHIGGEIYTDFNSVGTYEFQLAGRSNQFKIDRIALVHIGYSDSLAMDTSNAQSPINTCTSGILSNLNDGNYSLSLTDSNGCFIDTSFVVSEFESLAITAGIKHPECLNDNGRIFVEVDGGLQPYNYLWNTNPVATTAEINQLSAGNYNVVISDANGCTGSQSVLINSISSISISDSIVSSTCKGINNGAIYITALDNYEYVWSDGSSNQDLLSAAAGEYTLMVRDNTGCAILYNYVINSVQDIVLTEIHTDESATGASDGSALVTATLGAEPYQFLWNTNPNQFTGSATSLTAGTYHCIVTDSIGCFEVIGVTIE